MAQSATKRSAKPRVAPKPPVTGKGKASPKPTTGTPRQNTKQAKLIALLRRPSGATLADLVKATGWQPHTVRGAISGALKKRLGLKVASEKVEGKERVYRLS